MGQHPSRPTASDRMPDAWRRLWQVLDVCRSRKIQTSCVWACFGGRACKVSSMLVVRLVIENLAALKRQPKRQNSLDPFAYIQKLPISKEGLQRLQGLGGVCTETAFVTEFSHDFCHAVAMASFETLPVPHRCFGQPFGQVAWPGRTPRQTRIISPSRISRAATP